MSFFKLLFLKKKNILTIIKGKKMSHINRKELTNAVAGVLTEVKKKDVEAVVETVFEEIKTFLQAGQSIQINGFGTLKVSERKARNGVNPKTKEKIVIPATKTVTFKVASALKDSVNA